MIALMTALGLAAGAGDSREEVTRRLESMKVTVDFEDVRLSDALDYLREVTGVNLVALPRAMEKEGEAKIRLKVKELSAKSVLKLLLGSRGLTASYRDGAVVILPREDLQDSTTLRMFDVRALQVKLQDFPGPTVELTGSGSKKPGPVITMLVEPTNPVPDEFLMDMIKANTGAGSWDSNPKAALSLQNGMLVVNQTPSVLREIDALLGLLGQYQ
jgi:hypothetical protein